jgi:peptidoglycan hydrolase-like protein with peptidoglycan-binding domain
MELAGFPLMNLRIFVATAVLLLAPLGAIAAGPFTALHPEEAHPDPSGRSSPDPYTGFISRVQEKLRGLGFDAGPVNGDFGAKTQAALAQFQLSRTIPASGQLDEQTLAELGVARDDAQASAGASVEPVRPDAEHKPKPESGEKPGS